MRGIPIELSAITTLTPTNRSNIVADLGQIQMDQRTPIEVDEIRIAMRSAGTANELRDIVSVELEAGPHRLTAGAVPVWSLAPFYNFNNQLALDPAFGKVNFIRWVLPKPMVLPSGYVLRPKFTAETIAANVVIETSIVGRALIDGKYPRVTDFPFVAAWAPTGSEARNPETTLRNELDKPITIHRFVGHITDEAGGTDLSATPGYMNVLFKDRAATVELRTSKGYNITNKPTPFLTLFPAQSQVLPVEYVLARNEHIDVFLNPTPAAYAYRPFISFVASRQEKI